MFKGTVYKFTIPQNARPKNFLRTIAVNFDCQLNIVEEETFETGLIFKDKMITIWFYFEGEKEKVEKAYKTTEFSYLKWKSKMEE